MSRNIAQDATSVMLLLHPNSAHTSPVLTGLSVVVPCFNEADGLEQLSARLTHLKSAHSDRFSLEVVFVDDGSSDKTWDGLQSRFGHLDWVRLVRHEQNLGISASIMTGITNSSHEFVATIDADCTYDPLQIAVLFDFMADGVSMVTASPYHPNGSVEGVPGWRLALSKSASIMYGLLLGSSLHTYTSCFRLHRKSCMLNLPVREKGFVGVAEMLWQVHASGGVVVEAPARLTSRKIGFSKMRTFPVIVSHVRLMSRILLTRFGKMRSPT